MGNDDHLRERTRAAVHRWTVARGGRRGRTDVIDPSTGQVVTTVAEAGAADVDAAVRAAREAFDSGRGPG